MIKNKNDPEDELVYQVALVRTFQSLNSVQQIDFLESLSTDNVILLRDVFSSDPSKEAVALRNVAGISDSIVTLSDDHFGVSDWTKDQEVKTCWSLYKDRFYEARIEHDENDSWTWWISYGYFEASGATLSDPEDDNPENDPGFIQAKTIVAVLIKTFSRLTL